MVYGMYSLLGPNAAGVNEFQPRVASTLGDTYQHRFNAESVG